MEIHKIICDNCKKQEKDLKDPIYIVGEEEWQYLNEDKHFCSMKCLIEYLNKQNK